MGILFFSVVYALLPLTISSLQTALLNQSFLTKTRILSTSLISRRVTHQKLVQSDNVVTDKDREDIYETLGYIPDNLVSVAARRGGGANTPLVLKTYPLNGGASRRKAKAVGNLTPFPTLYWFCCNEVGKAISELERRGYVGKLEERLRNEPEMFERFIRSHDSYAAERWNCLSFDHQQYIEKNDGMVKILRFSGIAGSNYDAFRSSNNPSIKCLHAHYGHYRGQVEKHSSQRYESLGKACLIDDLNVVGQWVDELLTQEFPYLVL